MCLASFVRKCHPHSCLRRWTLAAACWSGMGPRAQHLLHRCSRTCLQLSVAKLKCAWLSRAVCCCVDAAAVLFHWQILNFSIAYGKTKHGLSRDWGVSLEEAGQTVDAWYSDRPEVKAWQLEQHQMVLKTGRVRRFRGSALFVADHLLCMPHRFAHFLAGCAIFRMRCLRQTLLRRTRCGLPSTLPFKAAPQTLPC